MLKVITLIFSALLVLVLVAAALASAGGEVFYVRYDLAMLDGLPGAEHKGSFILEVKEDYAPLGVARWKELLDASFFNNIRFFRVIDGFVAQAGIHGNPKISAEWRDKKLQDDPVKASNKRGTVTFATSGKNSRTSQFFINFADNINLDGMDFAPIGSVVKGMDVVDRIFKIGEAPQQGEVQEKGNAYLKKKFPRCTYIEKATIIDRPEDL